jgi:hypothetical protein
MMERRVRQAVEKRVKYTKQRVTGQTSAAPGTHNNNKYGAKAPETPNAPGHVFEVAAELSLNDRTKMKQFRAAIQSYLDSPSDRNKTEADRLISTILELFSGDTNTEELQKLIEALADNLKIVPKKTILRARWRTRLKTL